MTWREYSLRRAGYFRQHKAEWEKVRFTTYHTLVGSGAIDTRKISMEKFLPLSVDDSSSMKKSSTSLSKEAIEAFKQAQEQYLKESNG